MSLSGKTKIADLSLLNNILDDDLLILTAKRLNEQNDLQHITYKSTVQDLFNSQNFGDLAYKDNITSANIDGKINISYIAGLGKLAEKNKIISSDISDAISCSQIAGLGDLARKNKIISSDIAGAISCSQIAGLKNLAKKDGINTQDIYTLYGYTYNERKEPDQLSAIDSMNIALEKIQLQLNDKQKQLDALPNAFISSVIVDSKNEDGETLATITVNGTATDIKGSKNKNIGVANIGIGSIIAFASKDIPSNTLECNGQEVNIADYEALYTVIGDIYSTGDESEGKFRLPNLNDKFIQGHSKTAVLGSSIKAGLPNITGSFGAVLGSGDGAFYNNGSGHRIHASSSTGHNISFSASRSNSIYGSSKTVQPPAVVLKYVIVFKALNGNDTIINKINSGTIDGTLLTEPTEFSNASGNQYTLTYTVKNDCWLTILGKYTLNANSEFIVKINNETFISYRDLNGLTTDEYPINLPVTKGSIIKITANLSGTNNSFIFKEFKLNTFDTSSNNQNNSNCVSYVIESGRFNSSDGTTHSDNSENDSWYRLYSDGWCEQGGVWVTNTNGHTDIKFYNNFIDTTYNTVPVSDYTPQAGAHTSGARVQNKTITGFSLYQDSTYTNTSWEAKGFIN